MQIRLACLTAMGWALLVCPALADEEYDKLIAEFDTAQGAWFDKMGVLMGEAGEAGMADPSKLPPSPVKEFLPKFKTYAEKKAGTPDALPALAWIMQNAQFDMSSGFDPSNPAPPVHADAKWAAEQMAKNHATDPQLADMMDMMPYVSWVIGRQPAVDLLQQIMDKNPDKSIKAGATFSLASVLFEESPFPTPGAVVSDPAAREAEKKRALGLFRSLVKDQPDSDFAKQAAAYLYEAENLQIGMKAPEIAGQDAEGKDIKLSQFRGQVVVLDFWGFW